MTALTARPAMDRRDPRPSLREPARGTAPRTDAEPCGGAPVLDLALCLILAVTVVGLLVLAL